MGVIKGDSLYGDTVGLVTLDPGTTTGYLEGIYELDRKKSSFDIVAEGMLKALEFDCRDELEGAATVSRRILRFMAECNMDGIGLDKFYVVFEDFILYPNRRHSSVRTGLSPVRVACHLQGLLYSYKINWDKNMAGMAKQKATNDRLKRNDLWIKGSAHKRDAVRHAVLWVDRALS